MTERAEALRDAWFTVDAEAIACKDAGNNEGWYACNRALNRIEKLYPERTVDVDLHTLVLDTANKVERVLDQGGEEGPLCAQDVIRAALQAHGLAVKNQQTEKWLRRCDERGLCPCPPCAEWRRNLLAKGA